MYHKNDDLRSKKSKEWIYEALCQLIETKPYFQITITELIKRAGVGRSTFYRNYDIIDDVLIEKLDSIFEDFYKHIFDNQFIQQFELSSQLFIPVFNFWKKDSQILETIIKADRLHILNTRFLKSINFVITKFNLFSTLNESDLQYATVIISGIVQSVLVKWVNDGKNISAEKLTQIITETAFKE